jgi:hypothetical protein
MVMVDGVDDLVYDHSRIATQCPFLSFSRLVLIPTSSHFIFSSTLFNMRIYSRDVALSFIVSILLSLRLSFLPPTIYTIQLVSSSIAVLSVAFINRAYMLHRPWA